MPTEDYGRITQTTRVVPSVVGHGQQVEMVQILSPVGAFPNDVHRPPGDLEHVIFGSLTGTGPGRDHNNNLPPEERRSRSSVTPGRLDVQETRENGQLHLRGNSPSTQETRITTFTQQSRAATKGPEMPVRKEGVSGASLNESQAGSVVVESGALKRKFTEQTPHVPAAGKENRVGRPGPAPAAKIAQIGITPANSSLTGLFSSGYSRPHGEDRRAHMSEEVEKIPGEVPEAVVFSVSEIPTDRHGVYRVFADQPGGGVLKTASRESAVPRQGSMTASANTVAPPDMAKNVAAVAWLSDRAGKASEFAAPIPASTDTTVKPGEKSWTTARLVFQKKDGPPSPGNSASAGKSSQQTGSGVPDDNGVVDFTGLNKGHVHVSELLRRSDPGSSGRSV